MPALPLALSRTCDLADFPGCLTVASWQQQLAAEAWRLWVEAQHVRTREQSVCVNWSGCGFVAPGPEAIYRYRGYGVEANGHDTGEVERAVPAVYGLSVLDHSDAPLRFITRAGTILRPHGLLFLTFAFWDAEGEDCAEGWQDRVRIYDAKSYNKLIAEARKVGFVPFGGVDWTYHGDWLDDHSLASLVLTRR
jgi:hypothetical protein